MTIKPSTKKAQIRYEKETRINKSVSFHREKDKDLVALINKKESFSDYIKELIRKEIKPQ